MKKTHSLLYHVLIFVLAQLAWFSLLGLWIYWYVSNYIIFEQNAITPEALSGAHNVFTLVSGLVLLIVVSVGMSLMFIYLTRQVSLTRMYDDFIANITHELKSPLSSIQLYLETMQSRDLPKEKQDEFMNLMRRDIDRLNHLISSVLYMSGLEQKRTTRKYPHDYHIYQADTTLRELITESGRQLKLPEGHLHISGHAPCRCVIDRNWFRIVFDNLFDNARKYSTQPLQLNIHFSCSAKNIFIDITDNGIGIEPKELKRIFQKFQRLSSPDIPSVKGTGLGLYWVREIIKYHGGKISARSKGKGLGTTFHIELPVYKATKKRYIRNLLRNSSGRLKRHEKK